MKRFVIVFTSGYTEISRLSWQEALTWALNEVGDDSKIVSIRVVS